MPDHPDRVVRLQGACNFRDLGGYLGRDGRAVRWRKLFRSDHLGALTADDLACLTPFGLARAFDLRGVAERSATPYALAGVTQYALSIEPTVIQRMQEVAAAGQALTPQLAASLMTDLYRSLVHERSARFAELFEHLLASDAPAVIHCTAGKDRTGIAVAFLLLALGVSREVVMQDFMLTNRLRTTPPVPRSNTPPDALAVLWRVQESYLQTALQIVDQDYGGIELYLRDKLRVGPAARDRLAELYLQPG